MNIRPSSTIRQNYNEIAELCRKHEKMLKLREELLAVQEDRAAGRSGYTLDELNSYLNDIIAGV